MGAGLGSAAGFLGGMLGVGGGNLILPGSLAGSRVMQTRLTSAQAKRSIGVLLFVVAAKTVWDLLA